MVEINFKFNFLTLVVRVIDYLQIQFIVVFLLCYKPCEEWR